ncbi:MAG: NYN domain-containing protein [Chloroflexi bacterium]|nr:NYN domain-containing protein [Chloroflexota bacterium]
MTLASGNQMTNEVAVFIDVENLRYGLLNSYGIEPDFQAVVQKAQKYGRPSIMRAYADFSEHPTTLSRQLQIAGIEGINIPVKRTVVQRGVTKVERVKNAADMVLALDALVEALTADNQGKTKVFLIITGDRDYVRLVTLLRNRFGQRVIIAGVPGNISRDLVDAAGQEDPIEIPEVPRVSMQSLKGAIVAMVKRGPSPLRFWSLKIIDEWCQDGRQKIPGTAKEKRDAINALLISEGVFIQQKRTDEKTGRTVTETVLDEDRAQSYGYLADEKIAPHERGAKHNTQT